MAQHTDPAGAQAGIATMSNDRERERMLEKDYFENDGGAEKRAAAHKRPQERRIKSPARSSLRSSDLDRRDRDRDRDRERSRDRDMDRDRGRGASPGRRGVQGDARPQGNVRGGRARSVSPLLRHRQGGDRERSRGRSRERSRGRSRGRSRERSYERARGYPGRVWDRERGRSRSPRERGRSRSPQRPERREPSVRAPDRNLGRNGSGEVLGSKRRVLEVRDSSFASSCSQRAALPRCLKTIQGSNGKPSKEAVVCQRCRREQAVTFSPRSMYIGD